MPGLHGTRGDDDPLAAMTALLDEAGYTVGRRDQLRSGLPPVPQGRRAAGRLGPAGRRHRAQAHRAGRGVVRDHPEHVDLRWRTGGHHGLPRPQVRCRPGRSPPSEHPRAGSDATVGLAGHRVLLGRHRGRRTARPALRRLRGAAAPARPDVPVVRDHDRGNRGIRRRGRDRRGLQLRRPPSSARARQEAADRDRARPAARRRPDDRRTARRPPRARRGSACRCARSSSGSTTT